MNELSDGFEPLPQHPLWENWRGFVDRLAGPEGCNFRSDPKRDFVWDCDHDHRRATALLHRMGYHGEAVEEAVRLFEERGAHCDCEVVFNSEASVFGDGAEDRCR